MKAPRLAIVVPCYNEQEVLPDTLGVLGALLARMASDGLTAPDSYILCVDDCSRDNTWGIIVNAYHSGAPVKGIALARNSGQQSALLCGLFSARKDCDCAVTIDADLQDNPRAIAEMVEKFRRGAEIVYGVRSSRDTDSWFKRTSAHAFYRFQRMMGINVLYDHSEFRLMSARSISLLEEYGERNLFLRGVIQSLGLPSDVVHYARTERMAGETKYSVSKLISLSVDGITSFTTRPMRIIFCIGLAILVLDIVVAVWALISYFGGQATTGWTSLILSVWFLGGLVLMSLGIVGEYIGKIYIETKHRPRYAVRQTVG